MSRLLSLNRIMLLWLLLAIGSVVTPAQSFAACGMGMEQTTDSSLHACCVKKETCACKVPAQVGKLHGTLRGGCTCTVSPEPGHSSPQWEPWRWYAVATLPTRANLVIPFAIVMALIVSPEHIPVFYRFVSSSPPRAPPFKA